MPLKPEIAGLRDCYKQYQIEKKEKEQKQQDE